MGKFNKVVNTVIFSEFIKPEEKIWGHPNNWTAWFKNTLLMTVAWLWLLIIINILIHFKSMFPFYNPWKLKWFSNILRAYKSGTSAWNGLINSEIKLSDYFSKRTWYFANSICYLYAEIIFCVDKWVCKFLVFLVHFNNTNREKTIGTRSWWRLRCLRSEPPPWSQNHA